MLKDSFFLKLTILVLFLGTADSFGQPNDEFIDYRSYIHHTSAERMWDAYDAVKKGNVLFMAAGRGRMYDVADISNPVLIGELNGIDRGAIVLKISGDHLYVGYFEGVSLFDVSDEYSPKLISTLWADNDNEITKVTDFVIEEPFVYLHTPNRVTVVDYSQIADPKIMGHAIVGPSSDVVKIGDILLTCYGWTQNFFDRVWAIDASNPLELNVLGRIPEFRPGIGFASDIVVRGELAMVAVLGVDLLAMDLSDPLNPRKLTSLGNGKVGSEFRDFGSYAYSFDRRSNTYIYEMPTSHRPRLITEVPMSSRRIFFENEIGYCVDGFSATAIVDFSSRENAPAVVGSFDQPSLNYWRWTRVDEQLFNISGGFLEYYDLTDPLRPSLISSVPIPGNNIRMTASSKALFVATGDYENIVLHTFRVGRSGELAVVNEVEVGPGYYPTAIEVRNGILYLIYQGGYPERGKLVIFDVKRPRFPRHLGEVALSDGYSKMEFFGDQIYCTDRTSSPPIVIDVGDPENPVIEFEGKERYPYTSFDRVGDLFYTFDRDNLYVIDMKNLESPQIIGKCVMPSNPHHVIVVGNYAYVSVDGRLGTGVEVVELTDPSRPMLAGFFTLPHGDLPYIAFPVGDYLYCDSYIVRRQIKEHGEPISVAIDVIPRDEDNNVHCRRSRGWLPVAILTTSSFDAAEVDIESVSLVAEKMKGRSGSIRTRRHMKDVDDDGDLDMLIHFRREDVEISCKTRELYLAGKTLAGRSFSGRDRINIGYSSEIGRAIEREVQVAPNPFNPSTSVVFSIDEPEDVEITVYDISGREIAVLANDRYETGEHVVKWHGVDSSGRSVPSGQYFLRISRGNEFLTKKVMLLK